MFKKSSMAKLSKITLILLALILMFTACSKPANTNGSNAEEPGKGQEVVEQVPEEVVEELPAPRMDDCEEDNPYSLKCSNINEDNLYEYLGRDDVLYIDLRDHADYLASHLKGFEVVPYFSHIFDKEAGADDTKIQLYGGSTTEPVAMYEESDKILEDLIPKDKTIFFMCQSGGRVAGALQILEAKGYDMSKMYNVGGMGKYTGENYEEYIVEDDNAELKAPFNPEELTRK